MLTDYSSSSSSSASPDSSAPEIPDYLRAADNHNLGNQKNSWFSDIGEGISNAPKFMAVSMLSGFNSFYNTGAKIGSWFGADTPQQKTQALISNIDSDLGTYYRKNAESADFMGFLIGSVIPGIAGIKILNAGQKALVAANSGIVGSNLGLALGLRSTQIDAYIASAASEITSGQAIFSSIGQSGIKALASGVYQNVLEGVAFETAVQATMQASPLLDGQDKKDILWNIAMGGLFGGVLGGAFQSAQTMGKIRTAVTDIKQEIQPFGSRDLMVEMNKPANKIIRYADDLEHGPTLDPGDPLYTQKVATLEQRQKRIALDMRAEAGKLVSGDDATLARQIADINVGSPTEDVMARMLDTEEITRINHPTKVERDIAKLNAAQELPDPSLQVHYWKISGEDAGTVIDSAPKVFSLADTVMEKNFGGDAKKAVLAAVNKFKFRTGALWDASKLLVTGDRGHLEAEARYIWASGLRELPEKLSVHMKDLPLLERALVEQSFDLRNLTLVDNAGAKLKEGFASRTELQKYILSVKNDVAADLQEAALKSKTALAEGNSAQEWITEKIAKIVNVKRAALEGTGVDFSSDANFAWQAARDERTAWLHAKGIKELSDEVNDPRFMPTWAKVTKRAINRSDVDGNVIDGLTWIRTKEKLAQEAIDRANAKNLGIYYEQLSRLDQQDLANISPMGTGAKTFAFNNPGYNDPGTKVAMMGSVVQRASQAGKDTLAREMEGTLTALARNQEAVIEWGGINQKTSRSALQWYVHPADSATELGEQGLIAKKVFNKDGDIVSAYKDWTVDDLASEGLFIPVEKKETWDMVQAHKAQTSKITTATNERAAAQGKELSRDAEVFRPIPPNPKDYKFFGFVKDPKVTGQGHTSMIFAETPEKLEALVKKAEQARPDLTIHYKQDTVEFRKARQTYDYDQSMSENYLDSSLKNEGIFSDYFLKTDPQKVVDEIVEHHNKLIDIDIREAVRTHNQAAFDWLEDQAKAYSRIETSRFGGNYEAMEQSGKNPYLSYIKTALNLSRNNENPLWQSANKVLDEAVSKAVGKFGELFDAAKGDISEAKLNELNGFLQKHGLNTGYYDAATTLLVNSSQPKQELSKFVRGANAILSRLTLGLDPLNALNNFIGANILRGTELKQITDAIKSGDKELAGKLAALGKVDVTGNGDLVMAPGKLIATSIRNFITDFQGNKELSASFRAAGFIRDISDQFRSAIGDLSITGTETATALQARIRSAIDKVKDLTDIGERFTGNKLAEEMNRFISADVMRQITDLAVERGLMDSKEALSYINTFVNRVEGNVIASQRPFIFQGPIGQAIGLFQTYQFNLMQQMFRYVAEGSKKDAAMLLGLQGTFYGIQGLPAFQAINQHIIGTASGNTRHVDLYDATYGVAGKNLGDLLMYGIPSNLLHTNLYSRGDINPRQLTVIPTALNEVPAVGAFVKLMGSLKDTAMKISAGGDVWESMLQGIEHNGISRPLAGLAQTLQQTAVGTPMSTSSKGDILFTNDLVSLATLSRLAGGRPLDEAIVNDGVFRIHSYQQENRQKMLNLAGAIKASAVGDGTVENNQWAIFADKYAAAGGKQVNFNKFMIQEIKAANVSQSEKIVNQLKNPFAQKVQVLMGGDLSYPNQ